MTVWRTFIILLWCAVFVFAGILVGEYTGVLDPGIVGRVAAFMPISFAGDAPPRATAATPGPSPVGRPSPAVAGATARASVDDSCTSAQPRFVQGAASLKAVLGARMGDALDCEQVTSAAGDTEQRTSTGLVYYRASTNAVVFTNGFDHWALTPRGTLHWTGDAVDPPASAEPFAADSP